MDTRSALRSSSPLRITAAAVLLCGLSVLAQNQGILHGTVIDDQGKPIPGTTVTLLARGNRKVDEHKTDATGHFEFEQIPFGDYRLQFAAPDGRMDERAVRLTSGEVVAVDVVMPVLEETVTVTPPPPQAPPPPRVASSAHTLSHEEIQQLPRGDTNSVNEILAVQPGFVYDAFGNLYVRGNHANIQYQLDGVPLPPSVSGLFGGFLSPKLIENMEILTGGLDAEYGERLSAVVNLNSRKPGPYGEGQAEILYGSYQTFTPSALYGRKIGNLSILAGGSYRMTDRGLDPPAFEPLVHDQADEERGFVKMDYDFSDKDHLSLLGSYSRNRYQIPLDPTAVPCPDPTAAGCGRPADAFGNPAPPFVPLSANPTQTEHDLLSLLSYRHDFGPSASLRMSGYYRHSDGIYFGDPSGSLGPGADPCTPDGQGGLTCAAASDVTRVGDHLGLDVQYLLRLGEHHIVKVGGKVDQLLGRDVYSAFTRSDLLQAPDPGLTRAGSDEARATEGGIFAEDHMALGKLALTAGVRADFQGVVFNSGPTPLQVGVGPRLGAVYSFTQDLVAHAYAGLLWMAPPVLDTPAAARQLGIVTSGQQGVTYDLLPEQDYYSEVGIAARVLKKLQLTGTLWGRLAKDQLDDVEVGNTNVLAPYNFQKGRAAGAEANVLFVLSDDFNAFANATLESAQGLGIATAQYLFSPQALQQAAVTWETLDHVQTWTANGGLTYHDGPTQLSGLVNYGSGLRTGPNNNEHVPGHVTVDLTLAHHFLNLPARPNLALDVLNLFDSHYAYRLSNGFNGSHWAPGRSVYLRLWTEF